MGEAQLTMFGEQFAAVLLAPVVWLLVCKAIRRLRRRVGFCYVVALLLTIATCIALPSGLTPTAVLAALVVIAILYFFYKRSLRRHSFEAATIISYENGNTF